MTAMVILRHTLDEETKSSESNLFGCKRHNLLNEVRESARRDLPKRTELPPLPEIGDRELDEILGSFHAFK